MVEQNPTQPYSFADDPGYFAPERKQYGELGEYTKNELLNVMRTDGPRLMPGRQWTAEPKYLDQEKLRAEEGRYMDLRLEFEHYVRALQDKDAAVDHGHYWPNSSRDGLLRIDESKGPINPNTYMNWLHDSIDFYGARLAAIASQKTHGDNYRDLAWDVVQNRRAAGLTLDGKDPKKMDLGFDRFPLGAHTLDVGFYGNRLKHEQRGFDPRGFRLDAHHIPYTVTIDISKQIDEKIALGKSPADARKEARHEARAAGPAVMIPWDIHKALHDARNSQVFSERRIGKNEKEVTVKEAPEQQLDHDFAFLNDKMQWIGYSALLDINPMREAMRYPVRCYEKTYPPVALPAPTTTVNSLGEIGRLMEGKGKEGGMAPGAAG